MLELSLTTQDLAQTRFAFSPLWEVVASVRVLKDPGAHALHLPWATWAGTRLQSAQLDQGARFDLSLLSDLIDVPGRTLPTFLAPTPLTPAPHLHDELEALRITPEAIVRRDLGAMTAPGARALVADPGAELKRLTDVVETYWDLVVEPHWRRIRALLEGDVIHRSRQLAEGGADRLFGGLNSAIRWHDDTIAVDHPLVSDHRRLSGRGLVLVPSVFIWPNVASKTTEPWQPVLRYPARGIAAIWESGRTTTPEALAQVIGRSRAALLGELEAPASTTDLARRTGLTPGGVSQHLRALLHAGFVSRHRTGRTVLYVRTPAADALFTP